MKNKILDLLAKACFILVASFSCYLIINESIKIIRINYPIKISSYMKESARDSRKVLNNIQKNIEKLDRLDNSVYTENEKEIMKKSTLKFVKEYDKKIQIIEQNKRISQKELCSILIDYSILYPFANTLEEKEKNTTYAALIKKMRVESSSYNIFINEIITRNIERSGNYRISDEIIDNFSIKMVLSRINTVDKMLEYALELGGTE